MMRLKTIILLLIVPLLVRGQLISTPQKALWEGVGRIAISSDGNEHDHDDWAATPMTLALLAAAKLQDKMVLYTYSDHIWGSNQQFPTSTIGLNAYEQMRKSVLEGADYFSFNKKRFICAVDNPEVAYQAMTDQINQSSLDNPLFIIAAGPMQVVGEAINRSTIEKRQYVTVLSHSEWNNKHSKQPSKGKEWDAHTGWTFADMIKAFGTNEGGSVTFVQIIDQNGNDEFDGMNAPIEKFNWLLTSSARNDRKRYKSGSWEWLYTRQMSCIKKGNFDPSDAGMIIYFLTGIEKTDPSMAMDIMENGIK